MLAQTELDNKTITIIFNPKHIDTQSNLSIADTFMHEALHAEIYRVIYEKFPNDGKKLEKYLKENIISYGIIIQNIKKKIIIIDIWLM